MYFKRAKMFPQKKPPILHDSMISWEVRTPKKLNSQLRPQLACGSVDGDNGRLPTSHWTSTIKKQMHEKDLYMRINLNFLIDKSPL